MNLINDKFALYALSMTTFIYSTAISVVLGKLSFIKQSFKTIQFTTYEDTHFSMQSYPECQNA